MYGTNIVRLTAALDYAARKHANQRRKGVLAEPYINHPADVSRRLAEATSGCDLDLIVAGLLHDVMEDCGVPQEELVNEFGAGVSSLVREVTDDMALDKAERKRRQIRLAGASSPRAKMLRLADKTSNLYSLLTSPPPHWSMERRHAYFAWAREVADACRGVNPYLDAGFDKAYQQRFLLDALQPA